MDTIFAQATAQGRAGVSVLRISGPMTKEILLKVVGAVPAPRRASVRNIVDDSGELIDSGIVLYFESPNSFTGEEVAELQLHGSIAVVRAVLALLGRFPNTRSAEPGEFTRRALENGRLDLTQVEGLADLIESETEAQRKQAQNVLSGALGRRVEGWRTNLIRAAALLEATIDFADEDIPVDVTPEVKDLLLSVISDIRTEIAGTKVAERVRSGFEIAIVGPPNSGKSTLLNTLAGRDAALTSSTAGTTRDIIEVRMDVAGIPVTLLDTAGLRDTDDDIEAQGVARAIDRAGRADLRIFLTSPDEVSRVPIVPGDIVVQPKGDLLENHEGSVSGLTGLGVSRLLEDVQTVLSGRVASIGLATHARHRAVLETAFEYLTEVQVMLKHGPDHYDLVAAELRFAIRSLEMLVGRIDVENLLDEIFSSFCLGK